MDNNDNGDQRSQATSLADVDYHLFQSASTTWLDANRFMWSRFQTLMALQATILAGSYAARHSWIGPTVALMGFAFTTLLPMVAYFAYGDRERLRPVVESLWIRMLTSSSINVAGEFATNPFTARPGWKTRVDAGTAILVVMGFFMVLDLLLATPLVSGKAILPD